MISGRAQRRCTQLCDRQSVSNQHAAPSPPLPMQTDVPRSFLRQVAPGSQSDLNVHAVSGRSGSRGVFAGQGMTRSAPRDAAPLTTPIPTAVAAERTLLIGLIAPVTPPTSAPRAVDFQSPPLEM